LDVCYHLWDCGGDETDVSQGQVVEEEIHGGVERESELMARIVSRFLNTVIRYMNRNSSKKMGCRSGSSERPVRRNSETGVKFCASVFLKHL
jgi:hypothetical protein